jgi:hypothetical protein
MNNGKLLYVAAPYSHLESAVREHRFRAACRASALLMQSNIVVFSPLSHSVPIVRHGELDELDSEFWLSMDIPLLGCSDELLVLALDGWEKSLGVKREMFFALQQNKPITLIKEQDIEKLPKIPKSAIRFLKSNILTEVCDE